MTDLSRLTRVESTFKPLIVEGTKIIDNLVAELSTSDLTLRRIRGSKTRDHSRLFDEVSAALQFPPYFGENWDAFNECLCDLEGFQGGEVALVILISNADEVLADSESDDFETFVSILRDAVATWSTPINLGEWWDRPAIPSHVLLGVERGMTEDLRRRWNDAGILLEPWIGDDLG